jgi:hypothetical protein
MTWKGSKYVKGKDKKGKRMVRKENNKLERRKE